MRRTGSTTQESIARKTITVKDARRTDADADRDRHARPPPMITAPRINLPPVARIAQQCAPMGPTQLCLAQYAKLGAAEDLRRHPVHRRRGPDRPLPVGPRRQRQLRDRHRRRTRTLTTTYRDEQPVTLKLRVTDDDGATGETTLPLTKLEAECQDAMWVGRLYVTGPCLRVRRQPGLPLLLPNGKLSRHQASTASSTAASCR